MRSNRVVTFVAVACLVLVAAAACVFLYERASLGASRSQLVHARGQLITAVAARQDRERVIDAKNPGRSLELLSEKRARYGADATWRALDQKVADIEGEIDTILYRWPELR